MVAVLSVSVGCSSDDATTADTSAASTLPSSSAPTTDSTTTAPTTTPTTRPTSPSAPAPTGTTSVDSGGALEDAAVDAITDSFLTFFGGSGTTVDEKVAVLQDGEFFRDMLESASENEQFQQMSTDVRDVRPGGDAECETLEAPAGCAIVTHDVLVGGMPMVAAVDSAAVHTPEDRWLVGYTAWCHLVEIGGETCPRPTTGTGS